MQCPNICKWNIPDHGCCFFFFCLIIVLLTFYQEKSLCSTHWHSTVWRWSTYPSPFTKLEWVYSNIHQWALREGTIYHRENVVSCVFARVGGWTAGPQKFRVAPAPRALHSHKSDGSWCLTCTYRLFGDCAPLHTGLPLPFTLVE